MKTLSSFVGVVTASCLINGLALKFLWGWFVVPTFHLTPLALVPAIGIGLCVALLTAQYIPKEEDQLTTSVFYEIVNPVILLGVGWVVHLFM